MSAVSTYAEALFQAAHDRGDLEDTLESLQEFVDALHESEELELFFYGPQIPETQKRRAIDALTESMSDSTTNFLKLLVDNGRTEILEDTVRRYEELVEDYQGKVEVRMTTAMELSEEAVDEVKQRLGNILGGREVLLESEVDPTLVGGAVLTVGEMQVDASVRGQLQGLRQEMLERGNA